MGFMGHFEPNMGQNMGNMGNICSVGSLPGAQRISQTLSNLLLQAMKEYMYHQSFRQTNQFTLQSTIPTSKLKPQMVQSNFTAIFQTKDHSPNQLTFEDTKSSLQPPYQQLYNVTYCAEQVELMQTTRLR